MAGGKEKVWGEWVPHGHLSRKNLVNAFLTLAACAPSILYVAYLREDCDSDADDLSACGLYARRPNLLLHLLFFFNISVGFWIVGLLQRSFWLIDPYWTLFPPMAGAFYATRRAAAPGSAQLAAMLALVLAWSLRLTHSYFRREGWKFGEREDWRYTDMAKKHPRHWWWMSFFAVGFAQQFMLCPLVYPFYSVSVAAEAKADSGGSWGSLASWGALDSVAAAMATLGLAISAIADRQLYAYCNLDRKAKPPVLDRGLWHFSRHPNYVGEQIWWWSFALFAVARGDWLAMAGPFINSLVLAHVTELTEQHMLSTWTSKARVAEYKRYAKRTPKWLLC